MKQFSIGLIVGALIVLALSTTMAQVNKRYTTKITLDPADGTVISVVDPTWKPLTDDVAIRIYTDGRGLRRATLGVMGDDGWEPVAVDGPEALLPPAIPVR